MAEQDQADASAKHAHELLLEQSEHVSAQLGTGPHVIAKPTGPPPLSEVLRQMDCPIKVTGRWVGGGDR